MSTLLKTFQVDAYFKIRLYVEGVPIVFREEPYEALLPALTGERELEFYDKISEDWLVGDEPPKHPDELEIVVLRNIRDFLNRVTTPATYRGEGLTIRYEVVTKSKHEVESE